MKNKNLKEIENHKEFITSDENNQISSNEIQIDNNLKNRMDNSFKNKENSENKNKEKHNNLNDEKKISEKNELDFLLKNIEEKLEEKIKNQIDSQMNYQISQIKDQLNNQMNYQVNQIKDQLNNQMINQMNQIKDQLNNQMINQMNQIKDQITNQINSRIISQIDNQINSLIASQIDKQINIRITSQIDNLINNRIASQIDKQINNLITNQIDKQINSRITSQIDNQINSLITSQIDKKMNEMNNQINSLNGKMNLYQFINSFNLYQTNKRLYLTDLKCYYIEGKYKINDVEITQLVSLVNELYSFKNLSMYRKIANLLLEILIKINHGEPTKVVINNNYRKSDLSDLISFLFYVKDKISNLLHFSEESKKTFIEIKEQSKNNIDKDNNNKSFSEFFDTNNCTYGNLINSLNSEIPLLFFENLTNFEIVDKTFEEIDEKLKLFENFNTIEKLESEINNLNELKNMIDNDGILNIIKSEYLINEYNKKSKLFEEEKKIFAQLKEMENLKSEISKKIEKVLELKEFVTKNNSYFSFLDFVKMFKKEMKKDEFDPYEICKFYLAEDLNKSVDFSKDESDNSIALLKED